MTGNSDNGDFTIYPSTGNQGSNVDVNWELGLHLPCRLEFDEYY